VWPCKRGTQAIEILDNVEILDCKKQKVEQMNFLKGVDYTVTVQSSSQLGGG